MKSKDDMESKDAYVVWGNTDNTEGKGFKHPICICELYATAMRKAVGQGVMGSNARVEKVTVYKINGYWYGPVSIVMPSSNDVKEQKIFNKKQEVINRAKQLGLSNEEIETLQN